MLVVMARLHDTNNDTKLDGLEIMAALSHIEHMFEIQPQEKQGKTEQEIEKLKEERDSCFCYFQAFWQLFLTF
jgi:tellurite resistance protein